MTTSFFLSSQTELLPTKKAMSTMLMIPTSKRAVSRWRMINQFPTPRKKLLRWRKFQSQPKRAHSAATSVEKMRLMNSTAAMKVMLRKVTRWNFRRIIPKVLRRNLQWSKVPRAIPRVVGVSHSISTHTLRLKKLLRLSELTATNNWCSRESRRKKKSLRKNQN